MSVLDGAVYRHILALDGAAPRVVRLALLFLLQAIWLPIYLSRKTFGSTAEAIIRSAAAAVALAGLTSAFSGTIEHLLGIPVSTAEEPRLRLGYVISVLLVNGVTAGIAFGLLRWRIVQEQPTQTVPLPANSEWRKDLRSQLIWIACATLSFWLFNVYAWATTKAYDVSLLPGTAMSPALLGHLAGAAGLLFITPIPFLLSPREGETWGRRILKYSLSAFAAAFAAAAIVSVLALMWAPVVFLFIFPIFCVPSLLWGVSFGATLQPFAKSPALPESRYSPYYPERARLAISSAVWWSAAGYAFALLAGWLATTPAAVGFRGEGCLNVSQMGAAEYSFWKAYKGFASEANTRDGMIVRLSIDPSICMTLDPVSVDRSSTPEARSGGYVVAARVWSWLIDPEEWQSDRTMRIHRELTRLLGQDFASYDELQEWWEQNGEYLVWSGSGERLEVRNPDSQSRADRGISPQRHNYVPASDSESVRQSPWLFGPDSRPSFPGFNSLFLDREARLRALKLYAADTMQVLTGERERRVREYLHSLTGGDFATRREWSEYLIKVPLPPCMDKDCPGNLIALNELYGRTPPDPTLWDARIHQEVARTTRARHDDFLPWLHRPENVHYLEWAKAWDVTLEVRNEQQLQDILRRRDAAMDWLKNTTNLSFDSPEKWVQWWQENRSNLVLSEDGLKLVIKRR